MSASTNINNKQPDALITDHIDVWASAIKRKSTQGRGSSKKVELYGVKKLRELILELAVRGLLVPQDASEEPASVQIDRVLSEKERKLKSKEIKTRKELPDIDAEEYPRYIPSGWSCERLGNLINVLNGRAYKKHEMLSEGIPLLRVGNLFTSNEWYYSDLVLEKDKYIDDGDLIYAWSASFGPFIWDGGKAIYHYHIWKMDFFSHSEVNKFYYHLYLEAISASIKASGNGIAMIHMTKERMEKLVLPIPPLSEQYRIVTKVNELMTLCDQLEQQQESSISAHQTLIETLLSALINAADNKCFDQAWSRIAESFDTLFTTEHSVDQLKQTMLQLAVMGKLVSQDPSDEPANIHLEKIAAENTIKTRRGVPDYVEMDSEVEEWQLPANWEVYSTAELLRNGVIVDLKDGNHGSNHPVKADWTNEGLPFITAAQVSGFEIDYEGAYKLSGEPLEKLRVGFSEPEDVIYTHKGSVGRTAINTISCVLSPQTTYYRLNQTVLFNKYLMYYFKSGLFTNQVDKVKKQTTRDFVAITKQYLFFIAVPPVEEQKRIVGKLEELLALCERIKSKIYNLQTIQLYIADAIGQQLFGHQVTVLNNRNEEDKVMKISTNLSLDEKAFDDSAIIAPILKENDGSADAKEVWGKTKMDLPVFYRQLKKEIDAGFVCKPSQAEFGN